MSKLHTPLLHRSSLNWRFLCLQGVQGFDWAHPDIEDNFPVVRWSRAFPSGSWYRNCLTLQETQETQVPPQSQEDSPGKEMATHPTTLAWKIPWMEETGRLQSMRSQSRTHLSDWAQAQACQETKISYAMQCNKKLTSNEILQKTWKINLKGL